MVLERVGNKILKYQLQLDGVGVDGGQRVVQNSGTLLRNQRCQRRSYALDDLLDLDPLPVQRSLTGLRVTQQRINQALHAGRSLFNQGQNVRGIILQTVGATHQELCQRAYPAEGGLQVMGNSVGKLREFQIRPLQLMQQHLALPLAALALVNILEDTDGSCNSAGRIPQRRDVRQYVDAGKVGTHKNEFPVNYGNTRRQNPSTRYIFECERSSIFPKNPPRIQK